LSNPNPRAMANKIAKRGTIERSVLYVSAEALSVKRSVVKRRTARIIVFTIL